MNKLNQFRVLFLSFAVMVIAWSGVRIDHAKTEFNTTPVKNLQAPLVLAGFGVPNTQDQVAALLNSLKAQGKSAAYIAGQIQIVFNKSESEIAGLLKAAGYTVIQVAKALKNGVNATANQTAAALKSAFNASRNTVASALKYAGYSINQIASTLKSSFNATFKQVASALKAAGYTANQVAKALKNGVNATANQTAAALKSAFNASRNTVASALKYAGYSINQIASTLKSSFNATFKQVASALKAAGYTANQVAKALKNGVNATANQTAAALKSAFNASRNTVASALKYAGYSIRPLTGAEKKVASSVFGRSINLNTVKVTNTLGLDGRPWTTNSPPLYTINVGKKGYKSLLDGDGLKRLLIHELTHVWQGQHGVRFMSNSAYHQALSAIHNGGSTGGAYNYQPGKQWSQYNVEQQASIVEDWFQGGMKKTDPMYPYIRYNVRPGKPNATTKFNQRKRRRQ